LFLGAIDLAAKKFIYVNAGHHSPFLWQLNQNSVKWLKPTGPAIGLIPDAEFISAEINIDKGDVIVLYTDGLIEARNKNNQEYGEARSSKIVQVNKKRSAEKILDDIWIDIGNYTAHLTDDITLMVVRFV
jgi:sigma-B regulation protein RsbU (phosphoserine phosphatase)